MIEVNYTEKSIILRYFNSLITPKLSEQNYSITLIEHTTLKFVWVDFIGDKQVNLKMKP